MKKMMFLAAMMTIVLSASAMSYDRARNEALFLSDKMAYELRLNDAQYDAVYEINLDYLMSLSVERDLFGWAWERRNSDLRYVLSSSQWSKYLAMSYFYRPITWRSGAFSLSAYARYERNRFYRAAPRVYVSYRGGNNRMASSRYAAGHFDRSSVGSRAGFDRRMDHMQANAGRVNTSAGQRTGAANQGHFSRR